jgi:hypothetical protein
MGDALRELAPSKVSVAPTLGVDGSIDAFVEDGAPLPSVLSTRDGPTIVQFKDNRTPKNARDGWRKEAQTLRKQAAANWPGPHEPWTRALTYVYITSAVLARQQARDALKREIKSFFQKMREEHLCVIETVIVLDWSDVRPLLDETPHLADRWLGVSLNSLRPHGEQLAVIIEGFGRYLVDLPFVYPEPTSPLHPGQLLRWTIEQARQRRGVLVTGAGGVGKTRTLLETASRAEAAGWRVLHVVRGERTLTGADLESEILPYGKDTLIVCDYFNEEPFNLLSFQQHLLPKAAQRGMTVAVLASARSERAVRASHHERADFFDVVDLVLKPEQQQRLSEVMEEAVAPRATAALGAGKIRQLAGDRPIIALFMLQEVEQLACTGRLDEAQLSAIRPGDLLHWLRRRFREDELIAGASSPWDEEVKPSLLGAAAALALCPRPEADVCALMRDVLTHDRQVEDPERKAKQFVRALLELRWIRDANGLLEVTHDVVTDYLLDQALHTAGNRVRDEILEALLQPCATLPDALAQFATALGRLVNQGGSFAQELNRRAQSWFDRAAPGIGKTLAHEPALDASTALWKILRGPPWASATIRRWSDVIEPWLDRHGAAASSWQALFSLGTLKDLPAQRAAKFIDIAHTWIEQHIDSDDAALVLLTLLERAEITGKQESQIIELAWSWYEQHRAQDTAAFVIFGILEHAELPHRNLECVGTEVLRWCAEHPDAEEAGMPLGLLILKDHFGQNVIEAGKSATWAWLARHGETPIAGFALGAMLAVHEDDSEPLSRVIPLAFSWLRGHAGELQAGFVLGTLLHIRHECPVLIPSVFESAWAWFERYEHVFELNVILHGLLAAPELTSERFLRVVHATLDWVEKYGRYMQAQMLLPALFRRGDLDPKLGAQVDEAAFAWLQKSSDLPRAGLVIAILLERPTLPDNIGPNVADIALRWLNDNADHELLWLMQTATVLCGFVSAEDAQRIADQVLTKAEGATEEEFGPILACILHRTDLAHATHRRASSLALRWLETYETSRAALQFFRLLLDRSDMEEPLAARILKGVWAWLEENGDQLEALVVLHALLSRESQDALVQGDATLAATRWLDRYASRFEAIVLLEALFARNRTTYPPAEHVATPARRWLRNYASHPAAANVLAQLLPVTPWNHADPNDIRQSLAWLRVYSHQDYAQELLIRVAIRRDLSPPDADSVVFLCKGWIEAHILTEMSARVFHAVLFRPNLTNADVRSLTAAASGWLDAHGDILLAGLVLSGILATVAQGYDVSADVGARAVQDGLRWLKMHPDEVISGLVVSLILSQRNLRRGTRRALVSRGLTWLGRHRQDPDALLLLHVLLAQQDMRPAHHAVVVSAAISWAECHVRLVQAHIILVALRQYAKLPPSDNVKVIVTMLRWFGKHGPVAGSDRIIFELLDGHPLEHLDSPVDAEFADALVECVRISLKNGAFDEACEAMPALHAIATRTDDPTVLRKVRSLVTRVLRDPRMRESLRKDVNVACCRLLAAGAWPCPERALQSLTRLGLDLS